MFQPSAPSRDRSCPALRDVAAALALAVCALSGPVAGAEEFTQLSAHEHGKVTLSLAVDGQELAVELESPALHVIGFERAPRTAAERDGAEAAARWLRSGAGIIGVPTGAGCALRRAELVPPKFDDHGHDHQHEHGKKGNGHDGHADYVARYTFSCSNPAALAWAEPWALRRLSGVETLQANVITAGGQQQLRLREPTARIPLR